MDWIWVVAAAAAAVGAALLGRRLSQSDVERLRVEVQAKSEALENRLEASRAEREVRDLILGSMQEGVLLFDGGWRTAFANAALQRHLGNVPAALAQIYPVSLREMVRRVATTNEIATLELEVGTPTRWLRTTAVPAGSEGSVLLVVTDVTEARHLDAVRRDFVANASHELKTPAASILAGAETLRHAAIDDAAVIPKFAEQLERDAVRLSRIVADLLDLSRLESGSDIGELVRLDVLVREEGERFREAAREAGLTFEVEAPVTPPVQGSPRDLSLLVRNLVDNAIRYTRAGGSVEVSVASQNGLVTLRVSDTGVGIPTRDLPRVFERFYRVDRARSRETGGTGLGLSIVRHVAENHGGSIRVQSELGRGTAFEVDLPVAQSS